MISGEGYEEPSRHRHCKLPLSDAKKIKQTAQGEYGWRTGRHIQSHGQREVKTFQKEVTAVK